MNEGVETLRRFVEQEAARDSESGASEALAALDRIAEALAEAVTELAHIRDYTNHGPTADRAARAIEKISGVKSS